MSLSGDSSHWNSASGAWYEAEKIEVMRGAPCVVSVAEHTGWAHLVCVAAPGQVPAVIARRRVTLIDSGLPTAPYEHDSTAMREDDANALMAQVRRSITARSSDALTRLVTELPRSYAVVAVAIRKPPFADLPKTVAAVRKSYRLQSAPAELPKPPLAALPKTVAAVRKSYRLQCAADGMLYQLAICRAARQLGLDVRMYRRGEGTSWAAEHLGVTPREVEEFVGRAGRPAGPPWTQEHQRAYAAGIAVLAAHARR